MNETVICLITDNGYIVPTTVAITSLLESKDKASIYRIFVLTKNLTDENKKILSVFNAENVTVEVVEAEAEKQYEGITSGNVHVSATALYKFSLADIFSQYDRILYMDGDVLVRQDLSAFFAMDLQDNYAAVVKDFRAVVSKPNPMEFLPVKHTAYFNSGVMLLNLKQMREHGMKEKLIDYRLHGVNHFMDQDTLNVVFDEKVVYLPIYYNGMYSTLTHFSAKDICKYYEMEPVASIKEICENCLILHLCSPTKPWKYRDSWYADEWYRCYKKSPLKNRTIYRGYFYPPKGKKEKIKHELVNLFVCFKVEGCKAALKKIYGKMK